MNTTKSIGWSYPTSPNACRFGFKNTGCWTVELVTGDQPPVAVFAHPDPAVAFRNALPRPHPWSELFMRYMESVFHEHFFPCVMRQIESSVSRFHKPIWMPVSCGRTDLGSVLADGYYEEGISYDGRKNWILIRPAVAIFPGLRYLGAGDPYQVSVAWLNQLHDIGHQAA